MGRTVATRSKKVSARNRPATVTRPPASSGDNTPTTIPLTWNSGRISRLWSVAVSRAVPVIISAMAARLAWSSITPLGRPVLPLV